MSQFWVRSLALAAIAALGLALSFSWLGHPFVALVICATSFFVCAKLKGHWLTIAPLAIVVLQDYPITGSLLVSVGDLVVVGAIGSVAIRAKHVPWRQPIVWALLSLLGISMVGLIAGLQQLPASATNDHLDLYLTRLNAPFVFKGYLLGTLLAFGALIESRAAPNEAWRRLGQGVLITALVVALCVVVERFWAYGVWDFDEVFRASGPCFSMHIGGQHIDCFWILTLPVLLFFAASSAPWGRIWQVVQILTVVLSLYAIYVTMSRALIAISALMLLLAVARRIFQRASSTRSKALGIVGACCLFVLFGTLILQGDAVKRRFSASRSAVEIREQHATEVMSLFRSVNPIVGNGLGTYPSLYRSSIGKQPEVLRAVRESDALPGIRIVPGNRCYLEQRVGASEHSTWNVEATFSRFSGDSDATVEIIVCRKTLMQSYQCVKQKLRVDEGKVTAKGTGAEICLGHTGIDVSDVFRASKWRFGAPITIAIVASSASPIIVHSIEIKNDAGESVIRNGDFQQGSRYWFFTSDDHLIWRTKFAWLQLLVELGWVGVLCWAVLLGTVTWSLVRLVLQGRRTPAGSQRMLIPDGYVVAGLATLVGFLIMSVVGTLIDTPWILQLLILMLAVYASRFEQPAERGGTVSFPSTSSVTSANH